MPTNLLYICSDQHNDLLQLFAADDDDELHNLAPDPAHADTLADM